MVAISRRKFFAMVPMAGAAALRGTAPASRKMKMSLVCGAIGVKATQLEVIEFAHRYGFEAVEPQANYLASLGDAELQKLLEDLKRKNLEFGAAPARVDFRSNDEQYRESVQGLPAFAKSLQRAGVTRATKFIAPSDGTLPFAENFKRHVRRIREAGSILGDHGLRLGLEYVATRDAVERERYPFIYNMKGMRDLLAETGRANAGLVLDSFFWHAARETAADLLALTNSDVVSVDLDDAPAGIPVEQQQDQKRELPAATGVIDLGTFLNCLNQIGYDGPVRAEPFNDALRRMPKEEAVAATSRAMTKAFALIR